MLIDVPVPGNSWDRLPIDAAVVPTVSVIVLHYRQAGPLRLTLAALDRQSLPPVEIIVADDGSDPPPTPTAATIPITVVHQPHRGFRAAATRNLGARASHGEVLVFLDADTVPDRHFLRHLVQRVAVNRDVLAVGRRHHRDLTNLSPGGDPSEQPSFPEPRWLAEGYRRTDNLLRADGQSFRYVISSVLGCRAALFEELGGFDERFDRYGGEDWDFAYRAWNNGAVLVHETDAVAWHDGPEWTERNLSPAILDDQAIRLASVIPEPSTRGAPIPWARPDVLVDITPEVSSSELVRVVHSVLRQTAGDRSIRTEAALDPDLMALYGPLLRSEPWTVDQLRRARARLTVHLPLPPGALHQAMAELTGHDLATVRLTTGGITAATLASTRAVARQRRWADARLSGARLPEFFASADLEVGTGPTPRDDLGGFFMKY